MMPQCTLGDPLPYIPGSYHKTTTFVIENNVSPLKYLINSVRQQNQVSQNKNDTLYGFVYFEDMQRPKLHEGLTLIHRKQKILHNLQQRSLYRIQQLTTDHTVRQCTCISEADPDISIRGCPFYFRNNWFFLQKYQKIPRRKSK